jgi:hypothetical protein
VTFKINGIERAFAMIKIMTTVTQPVPSRRSLGWPISSEWVLVSRSFGHSVLAWRPWWTVIWTVNDTCFLWEHLMKLS